ASEAGLDDVLDQVERTLEHVAHQQRHRLPAPARLAFQRLLERFRDACVKPALLRRLHGVLMYHVVIRRQDGPGKEPEGPWPREWEPRFPLPSLFCQSRPYTHGGMGLALAGDGDDRNRGPWQRHAATNRLGSPADPR